MNEEAKHGRRFISLFGGIGGFDKPLTEEGWECVGYYEWDKHCVANYNYNFKTSYKPTDITKLRTEEIPDCNLVVGGSPCQDLSLAGKRKGLAGSRSGLFFEFVRIVKEKQPAYFIWENVKGAFSSNGGRDYASVLLAFSEAGYDVQWLLCNTKDFGIPQNRERIFVLGSRIGCAGEILPFRGDDETITDEISGDQKQQNAQTLRARDYANQNGNFVEIPSVAGTLTGGGHSGGLHSDMTFIPVKVDPIIIHNVYGGFKETELRQFSLYSPALRTPKGGGHLPMVLQHSRSADGKEVHYNERATDGTLKQPSGNQENYVLEFKKVHNMQPRSPLRPSLKYSHGGSGHLSRENIAYCLDGGGTNTIEFEVRPVLTPDRAEKRQNGRRFKEDGEEMFTLTSQDIHGDAMNDIPLALDLYNNKVHADRTPALSDPCHNSLRLWQGCRIRRLTPTECLRLQGFPDSWGKYGINAKGEVYEQSDSQIYKQTGNAVTTNVVRAIIKRIP